MTVVGHVFQLNTSVLSVAGVSATASIPNTNSIEATASTSVDAQPRQSTAPEQEQFQELKNLRLNEGGATCIACGIGLSLPGFESAAEQREHFKTDWHRYNVKRRLHNQPPASEEQFASLIKDQEDQVSSISGSSSESEQSDDEDGAGAGKGSLAYQTNCQLPQFIFKTADERYFAVWRCLLFPDHALRGATAAAAADTQQQLSTLGKLVNAAAPTWVLVMLRGGHFAAAVLRGRGPGAGARTLGAQAAAGASKAPDVVSSDLPFDVVVSKTFHRYVVRAKAGGKQSTKDGTGKFARSAGSRLRRYNEIALERDVQELLAAWAQHLAAAQLIFVHAPSSNSKVVFGAAPSGGGGGPAVPLAAADPRVRRVPFMTQRPTFSEVKRVARLLSAVFEVPKDQVAVPASEQPAAERAAAAAGGAQGRRAAPEPTAAPAVAEPKQEQQPAGDAAPAQPLFQGRTMPLHRAARAGDADRVAQLLESGHDPCQRDEHGAVPYALSADKAVRDAFRRFMAAQPEQWDYTEAGVPSALTLEMESAQLAKKADKKAKMKAKDKGRKVVDEEAKAAAAAAAAEAMDKEIATAAAEAAALSTRLGNMRPVESTPSSKVGGAGASRGAGSSSSAGQGSSAARARSAAAQKQTPKQAAAAAAAAAAPPTPEEAARRREVMAAAAEARMRALQQHAQQQQLW